MDSRRLPLTRIASAMRSDLSPQAGRGELPVSIYSGRDHPRRSRIEHLAFPCAAPSFARVFDRAGRAAARPFPEMVRIAWLVAARASACAAGESPRGPLRAADRAHRRRQDAGGVSADAGRVVYGDAAPFGEAFCCAIAGALFPPPSAKRRGGVGGGGCLRELPCQRVCRSTPHPRPLPATRCARGRRGEEARCFWRRRCFERQRSFKR